MYNYPRIPIYTPPSFSWPLPGHALYSVVLRTISSLIQVDFYGDFILLFFQLCRANRFGRKKKKENRNINHGYRAPPSIDGFEVMPRTNPNLLFVTSLTFISMIEAVLQKKWLCLKDWIKMEKNQLRTMLINPTSRRWPVLARPWLLVRNRGSPLSLWLDMNI